MANKFAIATTFSAINKVSTVIKKINADVGGMGVIAAKAQTALSGIGKVGGTMAKGIGIVAAGAGAASLGIYKLAESVSTLGDDVAKTARSLGMSTDALQEFRYIGERSGVGVEEMDIALKKLTINVGDASSEVSKSLKRLGISASAIKKAGPDEALNLVADGMARIKDPAERAAIAVDLFGKNGVKMTNVLSEGREGMAALAKEAHVVGYVLDTATLDASEKLNDSILNMQTSFKALGNQLASKFMPLVNKAVDGITGFLVENRAIFDDVASGLVSVFEGVAPIASKLLPTLASALSKVGGLLNKVFASAGPLVEKLVTIIGVAIDKLFPLFSAILDAAMPVITSIMEGFVRIMPAVMRIAEAIGKVLIPVFELIKPVLDLLMPVIVFLADKLAGIAEFVGSVIGPLVSGLAQVAEFIAKITGATPTVAPVTAGGVSPMGPGGEFSPVGVPISSQTSSISRTTQNNLSVDINNRTPYGVSAKSTGPAAPPITVRTGPMRGRTE